MPQAKAPVGITAAANASSASPASTPSAPNQPPFDQVIKGAERQNGLLPIWKRQEKIWLELSSTSFGKPFFLSPRLASGIGEAGVLGGLMQSRWAQVGRPQWVEFRKMQQQVQLVAVNASYTAQAGTPQALAVAAAFSPSLLGSVPLASAPHGQSGAVLIEVNPLLLTDMLGLALQLQRHYHQSYALDGRNTALLQARSQAQSLTFEVAHHFATGSIAASSTGVPGTPGAPNSTVPSTVPDPRSLFVNVQYTLSALPDVPMVTRPADARVGYFTTTVADFTDDLARTPRQRFINRWRLEKKDASASLSPPTHPLVYWLDPSIPQAYRGAITEGVLEWNKAFEAIGFKNVLEVRTPPANQPADAPNNEGHASIRWMTNSQPSFGAIGPTHVDPRTGEILYADIALESLSARAMRTIRSQYFEAATSTDDAGQAYLHDAHCEHTAMAAEQLRFGLDVLESQGVLDPDGPDIKAFVLAYLKDTTMHEVGHTLGLRHNFRASRWHTAEELSDPVLGKEKGNSASVMDYAPINLPAPGQRAGIPFQATLGPYDYWAIEYGYKPMPADKAVAVAALRRIAQRSAEPGQRDALAFGTDEDNLLGLDPQALAFDLGRDPVVFAKQRVAIVRDLIARQETRQATTAQDDAALARRAMSYGLRDLARTSQILLRQVGGLVTRRDDLASGQDLLDPLPAQQQRAALGMLMQDFLSAQAVQVSPALQRRLAPDYLDRQEATDIASMGATDFSLAEMQLVLQRDVLNNLMSDALAERLLDNADKTSDREANPLTVLELHHQLHDTIWPHLMGKRSGKTDKPDAPNDSAQRSLQREHVNRLAALALRGGSRADVRSVVRQEARDLLQNLQATVKAHDSHSTATAHWRDCIDTLSSALQASVVRTAP